MRILTIALILLTFSTLSKAQDCTPCVGVDQLLILSPTEKSDTLSKLMSGTTIGLYVQLDNAQIVRVDHDFTRLLSFTDDKRMDLMKKGAQIERIFEAEMKKMDILMTGGINVDNARISEDGHAVSVPIHTMAKPTNGAQTLTLEGQLGLRIKTPESEEIPVKNVQLSDSQTTMIELSQLTIEISPERTETINETTVYIFSYFPANQIIDIRQSASGLTDIDVRENEFFTTSLNPAELIVELPNIELMEVPFSLHFGLGL